MTYYPPFRPMQTVETWCKTYLRGWTMAAREIAALSSAGKTADLVPVVVAWGAEKAGYNAAWRAAFGE